MIAAVYLCTNGMLMVFDEHGQQLSDYQGRMRATLGQCLAMSDEGTEWYWMHFQSWTQPTTRAQVECFWKLSFSLNPEEDPQGASARDA